MHSDMEYQIHVLEQEAYGAILRAFKAQSDALTWEKEELITELRKELRVSDDEHRQLLTKVNADELIKIIREWRKSVPSIPQPIQDQLPSRKRPRISQPVQPASMVGATHPSSLPVTKGPGTLIRRPQHYQQSNQGPPFADEYIDKTSDSSLLGKKVMRIWSVDNNFYEATITDYNATEGLHALVYNINTPNESKEWVDLKEIPPEDIRWIGDDPLISRQNGPSVERRRGSSQDQLGNDSRPSQNGNIKKNWGEIEILHTDTLLSKVEKLVEASHPDLLEIENAKKMLKEHEQSLIEVIAKLAEACEDGSDCDKQYLHGHTASEMRGRSTSSYDITRDHMPQQYDEDEVMVIT